MPSSIHNLNISVHVTAYNDAAAVLRVLASIKEQTYPISIIRLVDNSTFALNLASTRPLHRAKIDYLHVPENIGTAGAINRSINWGRGGINRMSRFPDLIAQRDRAVEHGRDFHATGLTSKGNPCHATNMAVTPMPLGPDYLWLLDQDSEPSAHLLAGLVSAHQLLTKTSRTPIGIVAPLTRNRDDGQPNPPLRFDRYRSRRVLYTTEPVECDFLPASGMLLHLPSLQRLSLPSDEYFLDVYDFALGLAVKATGASVWLIPSLELSHQVGHKVTFIKSGHACTLSDMPRLRVELLHRNTTYLFTRTASGYYTIFAAAWQLRRALFQSLRFSWYDFDGRWAKAAAALSGWWGGLLGLSPPGHLHPSSCRL